MRQCGPQPRGGATGEDGGSRLGWGLLRCHRHGDREAVAICKHCMKALCPKCAVEASGATACSDACAREIAVAHAVLRRSGASMELQRAGPLLMAVFLMLSGLGFTVYGVLSAGHEQGFLMGAGALFALSGVALYAVWKHYRNRGA